MLFRNTAPAIPIAPMKEVKPDLSAAATVEQQELPRAAVTAIKQEVEQTPSGKQYRYSTPPPQRCLQHV